MPVGIVMVLNNTGETLHYTNSQTKHTIIIPPKQDKDVKNDWIPGSKYYDDTVPFKSSSESIKIRMNDGPTVTISDHDFQFCLLGPVGSSSKGDEDFYGHLVNGGRYVLSVDVTFDGIERRAAFTFLNYDNKFSVNDGYVVSKTVQLADPVAVNLLFNILPQTKPKPKAAKK